jgi:uncharacterized protein DUF6728
MAIGLSRKLIRIIMSDNKKEKGNIREYLQLNEFFLYFFRKKDKNQKPDFSLRSMHFVNKFSMAIFLIAIIYLLIKHLF